MTLTTNPGKSVAGVASPGTVDAGTSPVIDEARIWADIQAGERADAPAIRAVLAKAREARGLDFGDVAMLMGVSDPDLLGELFTTAREIKEHIYGRRLVLFAPLYVSNLCANECLYCAFRARNRELERRSLTQPEIANEVRLLVEQGHKRVLLVAGESYPHEGFPYILKSIETIYATTSGNGEIRRVNVNIAPLSVDEFHALHEAKIGTYQLFQETYHRETYAQVHVGGKKRDFDWRVSAMDRAMEAGIDDVGIGVLFGLFDWRFEILAMMQHIRHLEARFGVGPHTISVPRLEPASNSEMASHPPHAVSDVDFRKIVAILRLAVPYTGIIMSTRESANIRRETFALGVSQISAGSRTNPGGYAAGENDHMGQFSLGDHRSLDEVVGDIAGLGYIPSFCTACYRLGRTGADFMDMAKPGEIKLHCDPNALSTFQEYLCDYASPATREAGERLIGEVLASMDDRSRRVSEKLLEKVRGGRRDVFV
jgi:2-iminoacetate synthase